jgi:hypothetical protein
MQLWHDLSKSDVNLNDMFRLAEIVNRSKIRKFTIRVDRYGIMTKFRCNSFHDYGELDVRFEHSPVNDNSHETIMRVKIFLGRRTIEAVLTSVVECNYMENMNLIQDVMFSFLATIIQNDKYINKRFTQFIFPDTISSYSEDWVPFIGADYHRPDMESPLSVIAVRGTKSVLSTMPIVLNIK